MFWKINKKRTKKQRKKCDNNKKINEHVLSVC